MLLRIICGILAFAGLPTLAVVDYHHTLVYGENLKGFIKISELKDDKYAVSFDIQESHATNLRWALHMSSAPYDMTITVDNCKRVKKSPHLMRDMPLNETTVPGSLLHGHTIVLSSGIEILACATIILPSTQFFSGSVHAEVLEGHIHVVRMNDHVRLLPDLRYHSFVDEETLYKQTIFWSLVSDCTDVNSTQVSDGSEVGIDSRTTITVDVSKNFTIENLALYSDGEMFACVPLTEVEPRVLMSVNLTLIQRNPYEPVYAGSEPYPQALHIRDDCLDLSTETIHNVFGNYYPSITIFGFESITLKSLNEDDLCSVLRPHFPRPAATTYFMHPINGRVTIVDTQDEVLVTGELRNLLDTSSTRATIQFSNKEIKADECTEDVVCVNCREVTDVAIIVGKDDKTVSLSGVLPWFDVSTIRSAIIDLQWIKVCSNVTYLPNGSLSAHALLKSISANSTETVASIVALEYPANNYTEVLVNKRQSFQGAEAHYRPIDMTITNGHPCGEANIGPIKPVFWAGRLAQILASDMNDTSVFIWFNMITGFHSVLGTSVLLRDKNKVFCGEFEPLKEKTMAFVQFKKHFKGYIKLNQYLTSNWASGLPTEAYYNLSLNKKKNTTENDELIWDIVKNDYASCDTAVIFNPFEVEDACTFETNIFCPVGNATAKSEVLRTGTRRHLLIKDLPLSGPFSVIGKSVRIRSSRNESLVECQPLKLFSEATFRWQVSQNLSLAQAQKAFAKAANLSDYQVEVDYTREMIPPNCVIYRINVLADDNTLSKIQEKFDVEKKHFTSQQKSECSASQPFHPSLPLNDSASSKFFHYISTLLTLWVSFTFLAII